MAEDKIPEHEWHVDLQANEFLHYHKIQKTKEIVRRVAKRVHQISSSQNVWQNARDVPKSAAAAAAAVKPPPSSHVQTSVHTPKPNPSPSVQHASPHTHNHFKNILTYPAKRTPPKHHEPERPRKRHSPEGATRAAVSPAVPMTALPMAQPIPMAQQVSWANTRTGHVVQTPRVVPRTIEELWQRIASLPYGAIPNTPQCMCPSCPFNAGAPMLRRYHLMLALVNLENHLWGY